jgi:hypothetical protein
MSDHITADAHVNDLVNEQQRNIRVKTKSPFFITPNKFIQDRSLLPETKVVGCFLQSLPETWNIHPKWIQEQLGISRRSWLKAATQLKELKLLTLIQGGNDHGSYYLFSFFGNEETELVEPRIPKTHSRPESPKLVSPIKKTEKQLFKDKENINVDLKADVRLSGCEIREIFKYWQTTLNHPKALPDQKRRKSIEKALKSYSAADLKKAIDGCKNTPFNMGTNDTGEVYDDVSLIFRSSAHIERFIRNSISQPRVGKKSFSEREREAGDIRADRVKNMLEEYNRKQEAKKEKVLEISSL